MSNAITGQFLVVRCQPQSSKEWRDSAGNVRATEPFELFTSFSREHFLISGSRVEMSSRSSRLTDRHHSTLHAFFLAAQESGYTEFELRLVKSPKGGVEFCISPRGHSEISFNFEVRGNMVRVTASDASVVPADDMDFGIYRGTRSGEAPIRVSPSP